MNQYLIGFKVAVINSLMLMTGLLMACHSVSAENDWFGSYQYVETTDNPTVFWEYELEIHKNGSCDFSVDGCQTLVRIKCQVDGSDSSAAVRVTTIDDDCFPCTYDIGDILLVLSKIDAGLTTEWKAIVPNTPNQSPGHFFDRR